MIAKIIGFDDISFTDKNSGEFVEGKKVYYELIAEEDEDKTAEYGNSCSFSFFKNCIPLAVGSSYGIIFRPKKTAEGILYKPSGFYPLG